MGDCLLEGRKYQLANTAAEQAKVDERRRLEAQTLAEIGKRRRVHCRADVPRLVRRPCCFGRNERLLDRLQNQFRFIKKVPAQGAARSGLTVCG